LEDATPVRRNFKKSLSYGKVAFKSTVAAKILGHTGNYFCQQAMLLPLRFSEQLSDQSRTLGFGYPTLANLDSSAMFSQ
jgi:hypothetical protein